MYLEGRKKLGYFPLPLIEATRIGRYLSFRVSVSSALDPCIGDGGVFTTITSGFQGVYTIPESGPVQLEYRGLPLDEIEDVLPKSAACRRASRILFPSPRTINGRPLTPLHAGHVGPMRRRHVGLHFRFR